MLALRADLPHLASMLQNMLRRTADPPPVCGKGFRTDPYTRFPETPQPVEKRLYAPSEHSSRTPKPRHCSVLALMSKYLDAVVDYRLVLERLFQQADLSLQH